MFQEIYDRKPVTDPHIMFMGIGDDKIDRHPMQISQFEAGMRLADQLTDIYLEGNGGGNSCEGYTFPWYMAAMHTHIDCFNKRGKKGYLFTVGDEEPNMILRAEDINRVLFDQITGENGRLIDNPAALKHDFTAQQLLDMVSKMYHVFHVIVEQGSHCKYPDGKTAVIKKWRELLGQKALLLSDYTKLSEVVVSAIQQCEGTDTDAIIKSWDGTTRAVVAHAIGKVPATREATGSGLMRF